VTEKEIEVAVMLHGRLLKFITTFIAACILAVSVPSLASAEPAGKYDYVCVLTDGSSYTLRPGVALNTCKGSFLQKYIGGKKVATIKLTGYGHPATSNISIYCMVKIAGVAGMAYTTAGAYVLVGTTQVILTIKACKA
jgi:hypothetical protein